MKTDAVILLRLKREIDSTSLKYAREIVSKIISFYAKQDISFVDSKVLQNSQNQVFIKFTCFDEEGIIQTDNVYFDQITNLIFDRIFITSDPLIYITRSYKKGLQIQKHKWGFTTKSGGNITDIAINNIRNNILELIDEGYIGFPESDVIIKMLKKQSIEYQLVDEGFIFIKSDKKSQYQLEQLLEF